MSRAAAATPFPYAGLDVLTRADVAAAARLRLVARTIVRLESFAAALAELVDTRVAIRVRHYFPLDAARGADDAIGVMLATPGDLATSRRFLIEVEGALGAAIASRALRQKAPRVTDASRTPPPALAGAVAAVLASALRRAHQGTPLKVIAAGPGFALARDLAAAAPEITTAWLSVVVGDDAFDARVSVPHAASLSARPGRFSVDDLLSLGDAPLALPLVIASTLASRADLDALSPGDAFVPSCAGLTTQSGCVLGPVAFVPPRSERGIAADLAAGGRLVVRGQVDSHPWERAMSTEERASAVTTVEVLEDAPIVVRVELGTVEMMAREWAALGPGDVVTLGRKIGDHAILRVGGVEIARGELVQVEGEMAVRIASRRGEGG